MTGLWQQVLTALNSDQPDQQHDHERLLALELAHARRTDDTPVTVEDVQRIALAEFPLLLGDAQARAAHRPAPHPVTTRMSAPLVDHDHDDAAAGTRYRPGRSCR
ncbi:hypothetical protein [Streptomyces antibioticus]|uniref:hypothetical protein n=1 Tax=Streptomyces antibioticus TaxID=1890 RepID=UPI0033F237AC